MQTNPPPRSIKTRKGILQFPAYIPVTTFGNRYPLDNLVRPYLPRLAPAVMVSHFYAAQMAQGESPRIPMMVDSGGFVALFERATVREENGQGVIDLETDEGVQTTTPRTVLEFQETVADLAFTLDFPIPPGTNEKVANRRQELTIANALWAIKNRRRRDMPLYACVQAWDRESALTCMQAYSQSNFDGIAIGGLVPRANNPELIMEIVSAVRKETDLPLHIFGLGKPEMVKMLFDLGVDSIDSSSYVKMAAEGKSWAHPGIVFQDPSPTTRMHLALANLAHACQATLPFSASMLAFSTPSMAVRQNALVVMGDGQ